MYHKYRLYIFLLSSLLILSCKTTEPPSQDLIEEAARGTNEDNTAEAELPEGADQQDYERLPDKEETPVETLIIEPKTVESLEKKPTEDIQDIPLKTFPPRGGMKSKQESIVSETVQNDSVNIDSEFQSSEPEDVEDTVQSSVIMEEVEEEVAEDILQREREHEISLSPPIIEISEPEDSSLPPVLNDDLPSEFDELPSNPLIPIIADTDKEPSLRNDRNIDVAEMAPEKNTLVESIQPPPATREEINNSDPEPVQEPLVGMRGTELLKDEYTLSTDSSGLLIIYLEGTGWIFLSGSGDRELKLRDKSYEPSSGRTRFAFTLRDNSNPELELIFMKQDLLRGESGQRILRINEDENPLHQNSTDGRETDEIADTVSDSGTEITIADSAEAGILTAEEEVSPHSGNSDINLGNPLLYENAMQPYELPENLNEYTAAELYALAMGYEKPGPAQSLEKAMELYQKIKTEFPVTEERFKAETRIRYLNRHYFKVQ